MTRKAHYTIPASEIERARIALHLFPASAAQEVGVSTCTWEAWERHGARPRSAPVRAALAVLIDRSRKCAKH